MSQQPSLLLNDTSRQGKQIKSGRTTAPHPVIHPVAPPLLKRLI
jgi:hypothetical protein